MGKKGKLESKILSKPVRTDVTFTEVRNFLTVRGYVEKSGKGSKVRFYNDEIKDVINLHKPHPGNEVKTYVIRLLQEKFG